MKKQMTLAVLTAAVATLVLVMIPMSSSAQSIAYPELYTRPCPPYPQPLFRGQVMRWQLLVPNQRMINRWKAQNRPLEYEYLTRSPLNPESSIEYMLRTY